mgnify:CR=1 FL=1
MVCLSVDIHENLAPVPLPIGVCAQLFGYVYAGPGLRTLGWFEITKKDLRIFIGETRTRCECGPKNWARPQPLSVLAADAAAARTCDDMTFSAHSGACAALASVIY